MTRINAGNSKTILMTGVTGFIGSYLAAAFMRKGYTIIAMTRSDAEGTRTRSAIDTALHQDMPRVAIDFAQQLVVLPYSVDELRRSHSPYLLEINEVWHCAAEMSFAPRKLESSFQSNVGMTSELYRTIASLSPNCKRFFYVSTAYTGGAESGTKNEVLHTHPQLINPYQVSKWSTEMSLATQVMQGASLPVTLFRPSVVIGDTRTGYYPGSPFGIYMYFQALNTAKALGARTLTVDVNLDSSLQVVPIETLVANAMALSARVALAKQAPHLEIFHVTGQAVSNRITLFGATKVIGLNVKIGEPISTLDFYADKICGWVKRFGNGEIYFDDSKLREALGDAYAPTSMGASEFETLFRWYSHHLAEAQLKKAPADRLKQPIGLRLIDRFTSRGAKEKLAARLLKRKG
ncbi:MAG: SDR family oxidoreductase [Chitinophagaceae bacterium]|nr:SDR family oxidoreductase [Oligoflexus sp.]